jgi:hypothetical protein
MLLNTEVAIILKQMIDQRRDSGLPPGEHLRDMLEHVERFDLMQRDPARVANVRNASTTAVFDSLHDFELVQIVNLGCDDVDEAKTLIPSLKKKIDHGGVDSLLDNDRLHSILDTVASQRAFDEGAAQ